MAVRPIVPIKLSRGSHKWIWDAMGDADTGAPLDPNGGGISFSDKTVHLIGTDWDSATIVIEGSNDGVTYVTLTDPQGNPLSFTVDAMEVILENPLYIRPSSSGGLGSTDVDVIMTGRGTLQLR